MVWASLVLFYFIKVCDSVNLFQRLKAGLDYRRSLDQSVWQC